MATAQGAHLDYLEYASADPKATRKFLEKAFGWEFTVLEEAGYALHGRREGSDGTTVGIRALHAEEPPRTLGFTRVADLDAAIRSVQKAGGRVLVGKTAIPGFGWVATIEVPGAVVQGLLEPSPAPAERPAPAHPA